MAIQILYPNKNAGSILDTGWQTTTTSTPPSDGDGSASDMIDDGVGIPDDSDWIGHDIASIILNAGIYFVSDELLVAPTEAKLKIRASGDLGSIHSMLDCIGFLTNSQNPAAGGTAFCNDDIAVPGSGEISNIFDFETSGEFRNYEFPLDVSSEKDKYWFGLNSALYTKFILKFDAIGKLRVSEIEVELSGDYIGVRSSDFYNPSLFLAGISEPIESSCPLLIGSEPGIVISNSGCFNIAPITGDYIFYADFDQNNLTDQISNEPITDTVWQNSDGAIAGGVGGYADFSTRASGILLGTNHDEFTLATWIKTSDTLNSLNFLQLDDGDNAALTFTRVKDGSDYYLEITNSGYPIFTTDPNTAKWEDQDNWTLIVYRQNSTEWDLLINNSATEVNASGFQGPPSFNTVYMGLDPSDLSGGSTSEILRPSGNVNTAWGIEDSSYTLVDDNVIMPSAGGGDRAEADGGQSNLRQVWYVQSPSELTSITSVTINVYHRFLDQGDAVVDATILVNIKINGEWQVAQNITTSLSGYNWQSVVWNGSWTSADFNDFQVGITSPESVPGPFDYHVDVVYAELGGSSSGGEYTGDVYFTDLIIWDRWLDNFETDEIWNAGAGTINRPGSFDQPGDSFCLSPTNLFLQADQPSGELNNLDLFLLNGEFFESGRANLFIRNSPFTSGTPEPINLFLKVNDGELIGNTTLVLKSPEPGSGDFTVNLYTQHYDYASGDVNLFLEADNANQGLYHESFNLFTRGQILSTDDITNLFLQPTYRIIGGGFIVSGEFVEPSGFNEYEIVEAPSLFTTSHYNSGEQINLLLRGAEGDFYSSVKPLYVSNFENPSGDLTLIIGPGSPESDLNLYIKTLEFAPRQSGDFNLFTWSLDGSGTRNSCNIFIGGEKYQEFNLFLKNDEGYSTFEDFNLFLNADGHKINNNNNLVIINDYLPASGIKQLYIEGPDFIGYSGDMPLFIARDNEGVAFHTNIFIDVLTKESGNFNMFIDGVEETLDNNVNLVLIEPTVDMSGNAHLYTHGY